MRNYPSQRKCVLSASDSTLTVDVITEVHSLEFQRSVVLPRGFYNIYFISFIESLPVNLTITTFCITHSIVTKVEFMVAFPFSPFNALSSGVEEGG